MGEKKKKKKARYTIPPEIPQILETIRPIAIKILSINLANEKKKTKQKPHMIDFELKSTQFSFHPHSHACRGRQSHYGALEGDKLVRRIKPSRTGADVKSGIRTTEMLFFHFMNNTYMYVRTKLQGTPQTEQNIFPHYEIMCGE